MLIIFLSVLVYLILDATLSKFKLKRVLLNLNHTKFNQNVFHFNSYKNKIETKLFNLGYPYKITLKKYLFTKYVISPIVLIISIINYKSIVISVLFATSSFFILDYAIYIYKKNEKIILINEVKKIVSGIILSLTAYTTLREAFKISSEMLTYKRFKKAYLSFIHMYELNGFNVRDAMVILEKSFDSYDLKMFLGILKQCEKEGNMIENLENFESTLNFRYFKYLKRRATNRLMYVTLGTVLALINIILIVMYPIVMQVLQNVKTIFS